MARIGQRIRLMPKSNALLEKLNIEFHHDVEAFRLCVDNVIFDAQQRIECSVREIAKSGEKTASSIGAIVTMLGSIPSDLGYTWEGGGFKGVATVVLATGQQISVPSDLWNSFEMLHGFLLIWKDYPGHKRLLRHHYYLIDCNSGLSIDAANPQSWNQVARPGATFRISIALGTSQLWRTTGQYCPKCNSEMLEDDVFSGWRHWFNSQPIESWHHESEPIDAIYEWHEKSNMNQTRNAKGSMGSSVAVSPIGKASQDMGSERGSLAFGVPRERDQDREFDLKHVTMVWAPIFNMVFRARGCMCRLGGDSSPFADDMDLPYESPCRLHFPQHIAAREGLELQSPPKEYDPDQDPYFDRFGGRMAFAAFIATNPIVERSLDVRSLLPEGKWFEAANRLAAASQIKCQREALLDWQNDYQEWYFTWRSNRTKEEAKLKARFQAGRVMGQLEDPKRLKVRRGSFS
ncbi:hypothetical protein CKM354_000215600 [Cercospora kikuchii]|uniref:Ubiquitin-like domain-containing protein n=1 Tax=Cercospora kikuchii TaxID=84275 RepID=A0A9P3CCA7_9PEZI|nr:uncharacterized protein CKM354_000215600 [Cercospora kikuchii]GIZ38752.1 hypothetical protein CKM354_000215600 [Cercospora kikuchii]